MRRAIVTACILLAGCTTEAPDTVSEPPDPAPVEPTIVDEGPPRTPGMGSDCVPKYPVDPSPGPATDLAFADAWGLLNESLPGGMLAWAAPGNAWDARMWRAGLVAEGWAFTVAVYGPDILTYGGYDPASCPNGLVSTWYSYPIADGALILPAAPRGNISTWLDADGWAPTVPLATDRSLFEVFDARPPGIPDDACLVSISGREVVGDWILSEGQVVGVRAWGGPQDDGLASSWSHAFNNATTRWSWDGETLRDAPIRAARPCMERPAADSTAAAALLPHDDAFTEITRFTARKVYEFGVGHFSDGVRSVCVDGAATEFLEPC